MFIFEIFEYNLTDFLCHSKFIRCIYLHRILHFILHIYSDFHSKWRLVHFLKEIYISVNKDELIV